MQKHSLDRRWRRRSRLMLRLFAGVCVALMALRVHAQTTPTIAISLSPVNPQYTDTLTVKATVTGTATPQPTGTLTYSVDGGTTAVAALSPTTTNGTAYFPITPLAPGAHTVAVSYGGDSNYNPISAQTQAFTVADRALQINASLYPLVPLFYALEGNNFSDFGVGGVAVDANFNVYLAYGNSLSETVGTPVAPAIGEITGNDLNFQTIPVSGLGTDPRLAVDSTGNLYIADPTKARVVEYSTAGVQTNLAVTGLATPTMVTYDPVSGSLFILDSTLGGVIQFNLASHVQTTVFNGITSLDPALAVDGAGGIYYAIGETVMFRAPNGETAPIYGEFNGGYTDPYATITGLAFDPVRQLLWVAATGSGGLDVVRLDSLHHASYVGGQSAYYSQIALDPSGTAYTSAEVYVNDPAAANAGPVYSAISGGNTGGAYGVVTGAILQLPYGHAGGGVGGVTYPPASPGAYSSTTVATTTINSIVSLGFGSISYPGLATFSDGSHFTLPVYAAGYGQFMVSDPGSIYTLSTPFGQPAGLAYAAPSTGGGTWTIYISDKGANTVSSLVYYSPFNVTNGVIDIASAQTPLGFTGLVSPSQLAADGNHDVWVLDQGAAAGGTRVVRLDSAGNQTVPYSAASGDPLGLIGTVSAFAVDGPQDLYLGGSKNGQGVIVKIDPLGRETSVATGIGVPAAMSVDAAYNLYTVDATSGTLLKIDRFGNKTTIATGLPAPTEISLDAAGTVYLSSASATGVLVISPDGTQKNLALAGVTNPAAAVVDYQGSIYAADGATKMVYLDYRFDVNVTFGFGSVDLNTTATQDYEVSDVGNLSLGALTQTLQQGTYAPFSMVPGATNGCQFAGSASPTLLAPAQSCTIEFQYSPTKAEADTATANLSSTNPLFKSVYGATAYWNLSGTAAAAAGAPVPVLTPATLNFGSVTVGSASAPQTATLQNTGTAALTIESFGFFGANTSSFSQTNTCGASLAAGASCTIAITCQPAMAGTLVASLGANFPSKFAQQSVALSCTGAVAVVALPTATLTPGTGAFGNLPVGSTSAAQTLTLANTGTAVLTIASIELSGANAAQFAIASNACGTSLAAGASCAITVTFSPSAASASSATLTVTDNAASSPQTAALSGTGTPDDFGITASPPAQSVAAGSSTSYTVDVTSVSGDFADAVTLSASGLPTGATVVFSPATVAPGTAGATSTMTIQTATLAAYGMKVWPLGAPLVAVLFVFPVSRGRRATGKLSCLLMLAVITASLPGCGNGGYALPALPQAQSTPKIYTVTITGTSGSLQHSTTVQLTVE